MKLELSLPERPGLLHAVPVCDLFVILWLLFLLGSAMVRQFGVAVELPPSQFQLDRYQNSHVITLSPGDGRPQIHLGRDSLEIAGLRERLGQLSQEATGTDAVVLLQTDAGTPVGIEREVTELVLGMGYRLVLVGARESAAPVPAQPPAEEP